MGIAVWHFTVFLPDRFWGGIVGAFLAAFISAALFGFIVNGGTVPGQSDTAPHPGPDRHPRRDDRPGALLLLGRPHGPRARHRPRPHARRRALAASRIPSALASAGSARMQSKPSRWRCDPYDVAAGRRLAAGLGRLAGRSARSSPGAASATVDEARRFLAAEESHDPLTLPGVPAACELILGHVERGSPIAVFGDYDVDGVCSTAILLRTLRALGADPVWELPSRFDEGYGLSAAAVERLAGARGGAARHGRLRHHRRRAGGGRAGGGSRRGRHRPPPSGRGAARLHRRPPGARATTAARSCAPRASR